MAIAATNTATATAPLHLTEALHLVVDEGKAPLLAEPPRQIDWRSLPGTWQRLALSQAPGRPLAAAGMAAQPAPGAGTRTSWYRWRLPPQAADNNAWALYAARVHSNGPVAVYLDGQLVHAAQRDGVRWTSARTPLWSPLPALRTGAGGGAVAGAHDLLIGLRHAAPETGTVGVSVTGTDGTGPGTRTAATTVLGHTLPSPARDDWPSLSTVRVGATEMLAWRHQARHWLQRDLPALGSAAFLTVGLYSLVVWVLRRSDRSYLLFFALSAAAFLRTLQAQADRLMAADAFAWLTLNALFWVLALGHVFIAGLHRQPQRWLNATLLALTAAVGVLTWPGLAAPWPGLAGAIDGLAVALGAAVAVLGWLRCRGRSREGQWVSAGLGLCVLLELADRLSASGVLSASAMPPAGGWWPGMALLPTDAVPLAAYSSMVTFAVFGHLMYRRFTAAMHAVAETHRQLAQRLQQREAELTAAHQRLRAAAQQETRAQERRRLMQDMHDGLGASLQGALQSVAAGPVDEAAIRLLLRGCIDDLRLTIDSMEPVDADLLLLLATLRFRLGARLKAAGIRLRWDVSDLPRLDWLDPRCALHILRILQQTLSNSIQHAGATEIHVRTDFDAQWVRVQIADDGPGFDVAAALASGRQGLLTQQRRAAAMGGSIDWQCGATTGGGTGGGTCMTLRLPRQGRPAPQAG